MYNDFCQDYVYVIETRICLEKSYIDTSIRSTSVSFWGSILAWYPQIIIQQVLTRYSLWRRRPRPWWRYMQCISSGRCKRLRCYYTINNIMFIRPTFSSETRRITIIIHKIFYYLRIHRRFATTAKHRTQSIKAHAISLHLITSSTIIITNNVGLCFKSE